MEQVFLSPKSPVDSEKYSKHKVDNFTVYISNKLRLEKEVRIKFPKHASDLSSEEFEILGVAPTGN